MIIIKQNKEKEKVAVHLNNVALKKNNNFKVYGY